MRRHLHVDRWGVRFAATARMATCNLTESSVLVSTRKEHSQMHEHTHTHVLYTHTHTHTHTQTHRHTDTHAYVHISLLVQVPVVIQELVLLVYS